MSAGKLRTRVRFEREWRRPDGAGGYELKWVTEFSCWGGLQLDRGRERIDGGRLAENLTAVLTIRSFEESRSVSSAHRVIISGEAWNVRSVANPDQRGIFLELVIERGAAT